MKVKTTLRIDQDLFRLAKIKAANDGISLTDLLENALNKHLTGAVGAELKDNKITFASGPTIPTLQPNAVMNFAGAQVPGQKVEPIKDNRGVPTMADYVELNKKT